MKILKTLKIFGKQRKMQEKNSSLSLVSTFRFIFASINILFCIKLIISLIFLSKLRKDFHREN